MKPTRSDPCVLYRRTNEKLDGVTVLQVDESFGIGCKQFLDDEEKESSRFQSKPRKIFTEGDRCTFNGSDIALRPGNVFEMEKSKKLRKIISPKTQDEFVNARAQAKYIGCCTRPDLCAVVQLLATSVPNPSPSDYKTMQKIVARCHDIADVGLRFVPLDVETLRISMFTDASFANAANYKSQIGFVLVLTDASNRANIIHFGSSRCKRATRSVMAAEIHALVYGFDNGYVAQNFLSEILDQNVPIDGFVDSRTVFNVVAKQSSTLEKRLQIDVFALRESNTRGELRTLAWVPGSQNIADGMTKGIVQDSHPLWKLMCTNKLSISPEGWVEGTRVPIETSA